MEDTLGMRVLGDFGYSVARSGENDKGGFWEHGRKPGERRSEKSNYIELPRTCATRAGRLTFAVGNILLLLSLSLSLSLYYILLLHTMNVMNTHFRVTYDLLIIPVLIVGVMNGFQNEGTKFGNGNTKKVQTPPKRGSAHCSIPRAT